MKISYNILNLYKTFVAQAVKVIVSLSAPWVIILLTFFSDVTERSRKFKYTLLQMVAYYSKNPYLVSILENSDNSALLQKCLCFVYVWMSLRKNSASPIVSGRPLRQDLQASILGIKNVERLTL